MSAMKRILAIVATSLALVLVSAMGTVSSLLDSKQIQVGEHDTVEPAADTPLSDGLVVDVRYGRLATVTIDGKITKKWTTATTVDQLLSQLDIHSDSVVTASRSTSIGRSGIAFSVETPKSVSIKVSGKTTKVEVAGTVADAVRAAKIKLSEQDQLSQSLATRLTDGMKIKVTKVTTKKITKRVKIDYPTKKVKDAKLPKGLTEIKTKGVRGISEETWEQVFHDGKLVKKNKINTKVIKKPVTQVKAFGTKKVSSAGGGGNLTPAKGASCKASYYWEDQPTASGERFNPEAMTAAHKTLRLGTRIKVTNPKNGKTVVVRINDRGPYIAGRCLDLSRGAFRKIANLNSGVVRVVYEVI